MDQTFACILLLLSLSATFGKYVYVEEIKNRQDAQEYCRWFHTDLAPISNAHDTERLWRLAGNTNHYIWIGLERNHTDSEKWTWSGGGGVSTFFWEQGQPENRLLEDYGVIHNYKWRDFRAHYLNPFFCFSAVVVRERKTWEEALMYCREHHHDLASVASETEMMLIQKELRKNVTTAHVWIGLHFFPGGWLWVDRQPLAYEAWGQAGRTECPEVELKCAALQVMGGRRSSNGTDFTLATNAVMETGEVQAVAAYDSLSSFGARDAADVIEGEWEAHDCERKLHFICY